MKQVLLDHTSPLGRAAPVARQMLVLVMLLMAALPVWPNEEKLTMNMRDADIRALIQWVADKTGKNIIVHKDVQGEVTVLSSQAVSKEEAYQVFLSVLQVHGFMALESNGSIKIVPENIALRGGITSNNNGTADMIVNVVRLQNASAEQMAATLKPMLTSGGNVIPYPITNTLIIADRQDNFLALQKLIRKLDRSGDSVIEVVKLKHANARDVLLSISALAPEQSSLTGTIPFSLSMDERSNSILLAGDPARRKQIRSLIRQLDDPIEGGGNTQVIYLHYVDAKELVPILTSLAQSIQKQQKDTDSSISINSSESANALILSAPATLLTTMKRVIKDLDIRRAQILVEALIVEVSGDVARDIGVSWLTNNPNSLDSNDTIGSFNTLGDLSVGSGFPDDIRNTAQGMTFGYFEDGDLLAAVRALDVTKNTNILSTPTIVAIDNEEAALLVGQNVPFKTGESTGSASSTDDPFTTIERHDIGITLKVTPRINRGDSITMTIEQKTESIEPSVDIASDIITNKREIITKALIKDNQTLVLGGLISDEEIEVEEKVPFLGDIPLLGRLFKSTSKNRVKKNLMVFIHPVILKDEEHIASVTQRRYQFMKHLQDNAAEHTWFKEKTKHPVIEDFSTFSPVNRLPAATAPTVP